MNTLIKKFPAETEFCKIRSIDPRSEPTVLVSNVFLLWHLHTYIEASVDLAHRRQRVEIFLKVASKCFPTLTWSLWLLWRSSFPWQYFWTVSLLMLFNTNQCMYLHTWFGGYCTSIFHHNESLNVFKGGRGKKKF